MDKKLFIQLLVSGAALWAASIPFMYFLFPQPVTANDFGDMFGAINALFSGLALAGVIYAVLIQTEDIKNNQTQIEKSIRASEISAKLAAYSTLLQECDNAHERYERWEQQKGKGADYTKVKEKVRETANAHRAEIEKLIGKLNG